jgi:hypothetical protein
MGAEEFRDPFFCPHSSAYWFGPFSQNVMLCSLDNQKLPRGERSISSQRSTESSETGMTSRKAAKAQSSEVWEPLRLRAFA